MAGWTSKGNIKGPKGDTGLQGAQGPKGDQGTQGSTGAQGPKGDTGSQGAQGPVGVAEQWWSGVSAPSGAQGAVGDWWINTATGDIYEKTASSTWTLRGNIKGPQGATGATGSQGPQGVQGNTGAQGTQGPQGATGSQGPAGQGVPAGGTVNQIIRKQSATNYDTVWDSLASAQISTAGNPPGVVGVVGKMLGYGTAAYGPFLLTPTFSGKVLAIITFGLASDTANATIVVGLRYGTGTPPANQGAAAGTLTSAFVRSGVYSVNQYSACTLACVATGLPVGSPCWFDIGASANAAGQSCVVAGAYFSAVELP